MVNKLSLWGNPHRLKSVLKLCVQKNAGREKGELEFGEVSTHAVILSERSESKNLSA